VLNDIELPHVPERRGFVPLKNGLQLIAENYADFSADDSSPDGSSPSPDSGDSSPDADPDADLENDLIDTHIRFPENNMKMKKIVRMIENKLNKKKITYKKTEKKSKVSKLNSLRTITKNKNEYKMYQTEVIVRKSLVNIDNNEFERKENEGELQDYILYLDRPLKRKRNLEIPVIIESSESDQAEKEEEKEEQKEKERLKKIKKLRKEYLQSKRKRNIFNNEKMNRKRLKGYFKRKLKIIKDDEEGNKVPEKRKRDETTGLINGMWFEDDDDYLDDYLDDADAIIEEERSDYI
jgi:hypothetical protein